MASDKAAISPFDRGFLFGDGVYEVIPVVNGILIDEEYFFQRLTRSLFELTLDWPCPRNEFLDVILELVSRNKLTEGSIYLQITRGVAERDFAFPPNVKPTFFAYASARQIVNNPLADTGVEVFTVPDVRWKRRDIKSLNLLAQCMAKQQARLKDGFEAWMVEDGLVTEGASSSAFIVRDRQIITRPLSNTILPGIRRRVILELAREESLTVEERAFSVEEALMADEAFLSSATTLVLPVKTIDSKPIGQQVPGPVTRLVRDLYLKQVLRTAGLAA